MINNKVFQIIFMKEKISDTCVSNIFLEQFHVTWYRKYYVYIYVYF